MVINYFIKLFNPYHNFKIYSEWVFFEIININPTKLIIIIAMGILPAKKACWLAYSP